MKFHINVDACEYACTIGLSDTRENLLQVFKFKPLKNNKCSIILLLKLKIPVKKNCSQNKN